MSLSYLIFPFCANYRPEVNTITWTSPLFNVSWWKKKKSAILHNDYFSFSTFWCKWLYFYITKHFKEWLLLLVFLHLWRYKVQHAGLALITDSLNHLFTVSHSADYALCCQHSKIVLRVFIFRYSKNKTPKNLHNWDNKSLEIVL